MQNKFDFKRFLAQATRYWYLFIIILAIAIASAYFYLQITHPKFTASALLMIKDGKRGGGNIDEEAVFSDISQIKSNSSLLNEQLVLKSSPLMEDVVRKLKLQYQYMSIKGLKKRDMYPSSPIEVLDWVPKGNYSNLLAIVHIDGKGGYLLKIDNDELDIPGNPKNEFHGEFGGDLHLPMGKLNLASTTTEAIDYPIQIQIMPVEIMARLLSLEIEVSPIDPRSSALALKIEDLSAQRAEDILRELMAVYNQRTIDEKNRVYENSIGLINERINLIAEELSTAEVNVEQYKSRFNMVEVSAEGSLLLHEVSNYNKEISANNVEIENLNSIQSFLESNKNNFEYVPTNATLNNPTLNTQLSSFNKLVESRAKLRNDLGPSHPDLILTEKQIRNLRNTITDNIGSIKNELQISGNADKGQRANLQNRMASLPRRERELVEMERQKNIKENLYLYLLQKREESVLSLVITTATGKVIEPSGSSGAPNSPVHAQIWLIAAFLGLAIPIGLVVLIESLNDKIESVEDIKRATTVPSVGVVAHGKKNENLVVQKESQTAEAEMFRLLRANLAYIGSGQNVKTLLITSSVSGEGKSFIALNLGMTQALARKKVVILELDLRKPKQAEYIKTEPAKVGVVNYLVDPSLSVQKIIRNTGLHENLDIIQCGPKPPNPSELILSDRLRQLMAELREQYDFIIIDAPPVGLVADALQMKDITDATMFVVRAKYTQKEHLEIIEEIAEKNKLPKPFIVLNAVNLRGRYGGYGRYSGKYLSKNGKQNSYYQPEKKASK